MLCYRSANVTITTSSMAFAPALKRRLCSPDAGYASVASSATSYCMVTNRTRLLGLSGKG